MWGSSVAEELVVRHVSGSRKDTEVTYRRFPLLVGRADDCHVRFDAEQDLKVSALHAEIRRCDQGGFEVWDMDSRNGLFVNGERVEGSTPLPARAQLEIGSGGPVLDLAVVEGGSGISFAEVRRDTAALGRGALPESKPLMSTDDSCPAYRGEKVSVEVGEEPRPRKGLILVIVLVAVVLSVVCLFARG